MDTSTQALSPRKLTDKDIESVMGPASFYRFPGTTTTVCRIELTNGYSVIGQSACVDPAQFNQQQGERIAFSDAKRQIWQLEGYLLRQQHHEENTR